MVVKKPTATKLRLKWICPVTLSIFVQCTYGASEALYADLEFDQDMLWGSDKEKRQIDLSRFSQDNPVFPGSYSVQLFVNDDFLHEVIVAFMPVSSSRNSIACFTPEQVNSIGLNLEKLDAEKAKWLTRSQGSDAPSCLTIDMVVPGASVRYDSSEQRLDVNVPQAFILIRPKDYVDPALWDRGINAARMNYALSVFQSDSYGQKDTQGFLQLDTGFNLGGWRFRQLSSIDKSKDEQHYQRQRTYAQTDISSLKSTLTVGETYSDGQLFDSFGFRGALLGTDDRMLPASQRGYAPVVKGVANTNAKVSISQGSVILYQQAVAPGPFEIKELNPIGYGTDLVVTVTEADGQSRTFTVPYSASAQLLRPDQVRYSALIGKAYGPSQTAYTPNVAEFTGFYGLSNSLTAYGGVIASDDYRSIAVGNAWSTPLGGVSADLTYAQNLLDNSTASNGSSLRLIYSTIIAPTKTNITVSSYRYSTKGFWSFNDVVQTENFRAGESDDFYGSWFSVGDRQKSRFNINLNQSLLAGWGTLYLSGETRQYWNRTDSDTLYRASYNNVYKNVNYSLAIDRSITQNGVRDNQISLSVSLPLFSTDNGSRHYLTARSWRDNSGIDQSQLSLSGIAGENQQYNYDITTNQSQSGGSAASSYTVAGGYQGSKANVTGGITTGQNFRQTNVGISGGIVAHSGGITFGQTLGETVALVEAENAGGTTIGNSFGGKIDSGGYGLVPSVSPYTRNRIELDSVGLDTDVQLDSSSGETIPVAGSIVKVHFGTTKENSAVISTHLTDGSPLPFGAEVLDSQNMAPVGYVGQAGNVFVRGIQDKGKLIVNIGASRRCTIDYELPVLENRHEGQSSIRRASGACRILSE